MTRRLPIGIALAALGISLAASSPTALADPVTESFTLTNTTGGPVSRADFAVLPAGSIVPPLLGTDPATGLPQTGSPVTIITNGSDGFDPANFSVALGSGTNAEGLRLLFGQKQVMDSSGGITFVPVSGPNGEAPRFWDAGGHLHFSVTLDPAFQGAVRLVSLTAGLNDPVPDQPSVPPGDPGSGGSPNVPEPTTIVLWSAAAGLGLLKVRHRTRARA